MLRGCRKLLLALALLPGATQAQSDMPGLKPGELPGLDVRRTDAFAGNALYGYINGGADLYHEYGFELLSVQELLLEGESYYSEVYRMGDPGGAFGIFSVSRGVCTPAESLPPASCHSPHVVQWAEDRYFVRIANQSGSPETRAGGLRLAKTLSRKMRDTSWTLPPVALTAGATGRTLVLVRGVLGMQNGFDRWSRLVEGLENFEAVLVNREDSTGETAVGEFRFGSDADAGRFERAVSARGPAFRRLVKAGHRLLVMESDAPSDSLWLKLVGTP